MGAARLERWPGLDGLRGLAIAAVLVHHHDVRWLPGGFLAVSAFFTLSGFLITSLVLAERRESGQVRVAAFWARRLRRLAPVALLGAALATVVTIIAVPAGQQPGAIGDVRAGLVWVANWRFAAAEMPYFATDLVPSPALHLWSLSIEEQFYVAFPLVAALALRRRESWLAAVLVIVTALSLWRQLDLGASVRAYYGTDTRAAELAVGGLLAIGHRGLRTVVPRALVDAAGWIALAATLVLWVGVDGSGAALYAGGFTGIAVVSAVLVLGGVDGSRLPRALGSRPLVGLGRVSYGAYVFHLPLFVLLSAERTGLDGPALLVLRCVATVGLAAVVLRVLEDPVRRGALRPSVALPALVAAVTALALVPLALVDREVDLAADAPRVSVLNRPAVEHEDPPVEPTMSAVLDGAATTGATASPPVVPSTSHPSSGPASTVPVTTTTAPPPRALRIVIAGDSTSDPIAQGLARYGAETGKVEVIHVMLHGCVVLQGDHLRMREGMLMYPASCTTMIDKAKAAAIDHQADAIAVFVGSLQLADWRFDEQDDWRTILDPEIGTRYNAAMSATVARLVSSGVPVLWADLPLPDFDVEAYSETFGVPVTGGGPPTINDPARTTELNRRTAAVVTSQGARTLAFAGPLAGRDGVIEPRMRSDGLHLWPDVGFEIARAWLARDLRTAVGLTP